MHKHREFGRHRCLPIPYDLNGTSTHTNHIFVQIYSRATGKYIQIKKTRVDATGVNGSQYALLKLETGGLTSLVTIRGVKANRYLCLNKKGHIVARMKKQKYSRMKRCEFYQDDAKGYDQYRSARYPQWVLGFSKRGHPLSGAKSANRKNKCSYFLRYPLPNTGRKNRRNLRRMLRKSRRRFF
ncbi:fibroblast growth factor 18-like [Stylophora pistillata]|nr:fibroblast growth factor 18-like [Stylophora pistillata]